MSNENSTGDSDIIITRYQYKIAIVTFVSTLIISIVSVLTNIDEKIFDNKKNDNVNYPFEGVWSYKMDFHRYFGINEKYIANGKAMIIWNNNNKNYDILVGYKINKLWDKKIVSTSFNQGFFNSNKNGWTNNFFYIDMHYSYRLGINKFNKTSSSTYRYDDCSYVKGNDNEKIIQINCNFNGKNTNGKTIFYR